MKGHWYYYPMYGLGATYAMIDIIDPTEALKHATKFAFTTAGEGAGNKEKIIDTIFLVNDIKKLRIDNAVKSVNDLNAFQRVMHRFCLW